MTIGAWTIWLAETTPGRDALTGLRLFGAVVLILGLAMLTTSRRFDRLQRNRTIAALLSGGWIAIAVGFALGPRGLHVVEAEQLLEIRPLLMIGLGWVGLMIGLQARRATLRAAPAVLWRWTIVDGAVCSGLVSLTAALLIARALNLQGLETSWAIIPAVFLGACTLGWTPETRSARDLTTHDTKQLSMLVQAGAGLCAIYAVLLFGIWRAIAVRDQAGLLQFRSGPALADLSVAVLIALLLGMGVWRLTRQIQRDQSQFLVVILGAITLSVGIAAELYISPLFVAMLVGITIGNLSGAMLGPIDRIAHLAERPVAMLFYLLAGIFVQFNLPWWAWSVMLMVVGFRILLKPTIMRFMLRTAEQGIPARSALYASPIRQSPIAIALAVGLILLEESLLHRQLLSIVVGIGLMCELLPLAIASGSRARMTSRGSDSDQPADGETTDEKRASEHGRGEAPA